MVEITCPRCDGAKEIQCPNCNGVGERSGFRVGIEPFAYREGSNTVVLTARHRDAYRASAVMATRPVAVAVA